MLGLFLCCVLKSVGKYEKDILPDQKYYLSITKEFLAMFVGFIDGDGHISVSKNGLYFKIRLVIELAKVDSNMLEYFQKVLKIGNIKYTDKTVIDNIDRKELQTVLFPLLVYHSIFFLTTTRQMQYAKAVYVMTNNLTLFENIVSNLYYKSVPVDYLSLSF
jgi:hypothetical protein